MTTKTDTQAAFEKWLGSRADDPSLPHGLMRDAFCAGVEAGRQRRMLSDEEIDKLSHGFALQYQDHVRGFARALLSRHSSGQPAKPSNLGELGSRPGKSDQCGQPAASAGLTGLGPIRVSNLPTVNQDEYPDLGGWWVQLRIGNDGGEVLARVYGDTPEQARSRAVALAAPVAQVPVAKMVMPAYCSACGLLSAENMPCAYQDERRPGCLVSAPLAAPVAAQAQRVVNQQMTTAASDVLADTQRAIIEAAERRGYARADAENVGYRTDAGRYRFIRPGDKDVWCSSGDDLLTGDQLDAAIDAARVAQGE